MENTSNLMNSDPYITALKFSRDGNLLAVGDKTGKIHILNSENTEISEINAHSLPAHKNHVSSSVKNIEFLYTHNNRAKLFSSNEKTIKLWKHFPVFKKNCNFNTWEHGQNLSEAEWHQKSHGKLTIPSIDDREIYLGSKCLFKYVGAHQCFINSVSLCSNFQNFVSADDLKIFLWDANRNDTAFLLVDQQVSVKPISEVITSVKCHPTDSSLLLWTSTNGTIRIGDLRDRSICDSPSLILKYSSKSSGFFDELLLSISSAEFCRNSDLIISRDYLTIKIWDIRNNSNPIHTVDVMNNLKRDMNDLYQSQDICMKFEVRDLGDLGLVTGGSGDLVFVGKSGDIFERTEVGNEEILQLDVRNNNEVVYVSENQINRLLFNDIN